MKNLMLVVIIGAAMFGFSSRDAWARGHGGVHFGIAIGPPWGWQPYPYYYNPYYYNPYPQPVYVQPPAPVQYIQQNPVSQPDNYWYYCSNPSGYYPYVKSCPAGWMKVLPQSTPPQ